MLSLVAMIFAASAFAPSVANAFDIAVIIDKVNLHPESNSMSLEMSFHNNEDRPMQFWAVDVRMLDLFSPNFSKRIYSSGNFTIWLADEGDFIVAPHSIKYFTAEVNNKIAPGQDRVPAVDYSPKVTWDFSTRRNYAQ